MNVLMALLFILLAGFINGSFALPTKHVYNWKFENIWLQYAIWAFVILPWLFAIFLVPQIFSVYASAPGHIIAVMLVGGLIFGAGQVCFALALNMIGLGLGFVINLGLGIVLGFLLPLVIQHPEAIFTLFGGVTMVGCVLAVAGLIFSNRAGRLHDENRRKAEEVATTKSKHYGLGVFLAILAGLSSAGQNFCFSFTSGLQQFALHLGAQPVGAATVMWPGFLLCAFIPYALYMLYLLRKNRTFTGFVKRGTAHYYLFALLMGACWYGSLIFYSKASHLIGKLGPLVGWPLFMVLIILTSNFWGWRHREWAGCSKKVRDVLWVGLLCLIFAVVVLGYSSYFHA